MRLTAIIANTVHAANVNGPITYRRVTVELTPTQEQQLKLLDQQWEQYAMLFFEVSSKPEESN